MSNRIVVFTGKLSYSVRKGIVEIDRSIPALTWLIVVHSPDRKIGRLARNQWRNLRRNGWRWIPYQIGDLFQQVKARNTTTKPSTLVGSENVLSALESRHNFKFLKVGDIHAEDTLKRVREFAPDLGLSLAAPILRRALFSIPKLGTLNLHKGRLPDYRGMPPAFWELWNGEQSVGCSVHWVDDKLDTGALVAECTVEREKFSGLHGLQLRLDEAGVYLMQKAVAAALEGTLRSVPQRQGGKTHRKPTLAQVAHLNRMLGKAQPRGSSPVKQAVKNAAGELAFAAWRVGLRGLLKPRITVLLYHRVSDAARDNLTVGIEQFDKHMALLREYCHPVSIEDVIAHQAIPRTDKPLVCVTFDDGYLDNYLNAAPILLRNQVPAAFFVSTGIISNKGRFPHDVRRGNPEIPVMSWQQLRELRDRGFCIGSHSMSHIDCASEPEEIVWNELVGSREDLRRELGLDGAIFAYPYGGRQHMTPARLEIVKKAGYSACLSAYGGSNIGTVDRFNVLRRGIHWEFSDQSFLVECLGLT